MRELIY